MLKKDGSKQKVGVILTSEEHAYVGTWESGWMEERGKSLKKTVAPKLCLSLGEIPPGAHSIHFIWVFSASCTVFPPQSPSQGCLVSTNYFSWLLLPVLAMSPSVMKEFKDLGPLLKNSSCKVGKRNQNDKCFPAQQRPNQLTQHGAPELVLKWAAKRPSSIFCLKPSRSSSPVIYCQFSLKAQSHMALTLWRTLAVLEKPIKCTSQQSFNKQSD